MLQCRFCLGEVEDVDEDGIVECACGARFPVHESLFASGGANLRDEVEDAELDDEEMGDLDDDLDLEF